MIRTDFTDEVAWRRVVAVLLDDRECQIVDDPAFDGVTADELARVAGDVQPEVVFVADAEAMRGERALLAFTTKRPEWFTDAAEGELPLLAVNTATPQDLRDMPEEYEYETKHGRQCRVLPESVAEMQSDRSSGRSFAEFAESAAHDADHIHRGWS